MANKTTNIVMFPGTDALEDGATRHAVWQFPHVRAKIAETKQILESIAPVKWDFETFMQGGDFETGEFFKHLVFASLATQVAIFEDYEKQGLPCDYLMGISLGDIARDVASGVGSFEVAVIALLQFVSLVENSNDDFTNIGSSYFVKIPKPLPQYRDTLKLEQYNLEVAVHQNERFFLLAGMNDDFLKWQDEIANDLGLKLRFMYPFALHCDLMAEVAAKLKPYIYEVIRFDKMKYPLFSSITQDVITTEAELKEEINLNIVKTVRIVDTVQTILKKFEHVNFINIGPAPTMITFIRLMGLEKKNYELNDYFKTWLAEQNDFHGIKK